MSERGRGYRLLLEPPPAQVSAAAAYPPIAADGAGSAYVLGAADGARSTQVSATRRGARPHRFGWFLLGVLAALVVIFVGAANVFTRPEPILREGSRGEDVLTLQRELAAAGYDPVYLDGQYGPLTARAVRAFQQGNGVVVDGEVGPETRAALRRAPRTHAVTPTSP